VLLLLLLLLLLCSKQVNVVLQRGVNDDEVADFVEMTRHQPINVRFIEYMPFDGNAFSTNKMVPYREVMARINDR
jgi:cyclic pyranopterin phosphate synthase